MTTLLETATHNDVHDAVHDDADTATCRLCPPDGGTVVARFSGDGPARRAGERASAEARATGIAHHDHYDPALDAFVVICHQRC